jgi:hypothetical protein
VKCIDASIFKKLASSFLYFLRLAQEVIDLESEDALFERVVPGATEKPVGISKAPLAKSLLYCVGHDRSPC